METVITLKFVDLLWTEGNKNCIVDRKVKGQHELKDECHYLLPTYETGEATWKTVAKQSCGKLYGPACFWDTRQVIYPCDRNRCWIGCPCMSCLKKELQNLNRKQLFDDHNRYHHARHYCCEFCDQLFSMFPGFTYMSPVGALIRTPRFQRVLYPMYLMKHTEHVAFCDFNRPIKKRKLKCDECNITFTQSSDKERHDKAIHYEEKIMCEFCPKVFNRKSSLDRHIKTIHGSIQSQNWLTCSDCKSCFINTFTLKRHIANKYDKNGKAVNLCDICNSELCSKKLLREHLKCHQNVCQICEKSFSTKSYLEKHKQGEQIVCKVCDLIVCNRKQMYKHMINHKQDQFKCDCCKAEFKKKWMLVRHKSDSKMCEYCNQELCCVSVFRNHMLLRHNYMYCSKCGGFILIGANQMHEDCANTLEESKYECNLCDKKFKSKRGFNNHSAHILDQHYSEEWGILKTKKMFENEDCLGIFSSKYPHPQRKNIPLMYLHSKSCWLSTEKHCQCEDRPQSVIDQNVLLSDNYLFVRQIHLSYQTVSTTKDKGKVDWESLKKIMVEHISFSDFKF